MSSNKQIRIISRNGRYFLRWCILDADGNVDKVTPDYPEQQEWKCLEDMKGYFNLLAEASRMSVIHVTCINSKDLVLRGLED